MCSAQCLTHSRYLIWISWISGSIIICLFDRSSTMFLSFSGFEIQELFFPVFYLINTSHLTTRGKRKNWNFVSNSMLSLGVGLSPHRKLDKLPDTENILQGKQIITTASWPGELESCRVNYTLSLICILLPLWLPMHHVSITKAYDEDKDAFSLFLFHSAPNETMES